MRQRDRNVSLLFPEHPLEGIQVNTGIAAIAYDAQSVTVFLVWHAAAVEPACLRFFKTCHDGHVVSDPGESLWSVEGFTAINTLTAKLYN